MKANRADLASTTQREEEIRKMTLAAGEEKWCFFYTTTRSLTYFILDHHHGIHTFIGIKEDDQTSGKLDLEIMRYNIEIWLMMGMVHTSHFILSCQTQSHWHCGNDDPLFRWSGGCCSSCRRRRRWKRRRKDPSIMHIHIFVALLACFSCCC